MTTDAPYKVVFTPVGWQVVYTRETRDPYMQFGLGMEDYRLAKESCDELNVPDPEVSTRTTARQSSPSSEPGNG